MALPQKWGSRFLLGPLWTSGGHGKGAQRDHHVLAALSPSLPPWALGQGQQQVVAPYSWVPGFLRTATLQVGSHNQGAPRACMAFTQTIFPGQMG